MKTRIGVIILAVVCVGLAVALFSTMKSADEQKTNDATTISTLSNKWVEVTDRLGEQQQVNTALTNDLTARETKIAELTNQLGQVSLTLTQTEASLKASQEETAKRDAKIADLEAQNTALDRRAVDLSTSITNLNAQIEDTQQKLARSEGDKAFLKKELDRLMADKAELERQFNDLAVLRTQVAKLKEEMYVSRRLDWMRRGIYANASERGGQQLIQHGPTAPAAAASTGHFDLNVEIGADGSVRVIGPMTNGPAATNPPSAK